MVLRFYWLLLISLLLVALEVVSASHGVLFPAGLFLAFYVGLAFGPRRGMACGLMVTIGVEILTVRSVTLIPVFLPFLAFLVIFRKLGDRTSAINHAVTGFALAGLHAGWLLLLENIHFRHGWSLLSGPTAVRLFLVSLLAGTLGFPLMIRLLDSVADRLAVEQFMLQSSRVG